ncbi:hypothetical protein RR46_15200 [Papilio xuthus]|uniref:Uncharacterized protein n=1 Tax=Papilio xuthus TaxID=66420 RepID=A0A194PEB7_PAPXU|nr:hypothetical protein RR46_15200 [Papilio xuthus]
MLPSATKKQLQLMRIINHNVKSFLTIACVGVMLGMLLDESVR